MDKMFLKRSNHDLKTFEKYYKNEKYSSTFPNLSKNTTLLVPIPRKNKNFVNLFYFMKKESNLQQKELWKMVVKEVNKRLEKDKYIWVSTHGLGVDYLHIRISSSPNYYGNSKLRHKPN